MRRFRVSIAGLLAGVALFAVAITALIHPSPLWGNAFYTLTLSCLTIALLAAAYGRGRRRAFWVGFSACGWMYFLTIFGPEPISHVGSNFVTTAILDIFYPFTLPREPLAAQAPSAAVRSSPEIPLLKRWRGDGPKIILTGAFAGGGLPLLPPNFWETWTTPDRLTQFNFQQGSPLMYRRIGHSLFCLLVASTGGFLTRRFQEIRSREAEA